MCFHALAWAWQRLNWVTSQAAGPGNSQHPLWHCCSSLRLRDRQRQPRPRRPRLAPTRSSQDPHLLEPLPTRSDRRCKRDPKTSEANPTSPSGSLDTTTTLGEASFRHVFGSLRLATDIYPAGQAWGPSWVPLPLLVCAASKWSSPCSYDWAPSPSSVAAPDCGNGASTTA